MPQVPRTVVKPLPWNTINLFKIDRSPEDEFFHLPWLKIRTYGMFFNSYHSLRIKYYGNPMFSLEGYFAFKLLFHPIPPNLKAKGVENHLLWLNIPRASHKFKATNNQHPYLPLLLGWGFPQQAPFQAAQCARFQGPGTDHPGGHKGLIDMPGVRSQGWQHFLRLQSWKKKEGIKNDCQLGRWEGG